ncbi:MAG: hypothetical protein WCQ59_07355 [Candidatus Cloacimonadaceae bacterium]
MKRYLLALALVIPCFALLALTALHVSPESFVPDRDVELLLEITQGREEISGIDVQYRLVGSTVWQAEPMRQDDPASTYWRGFIPKTAVSTNDVEYRFEIKLLSGASEYLPADDGITPLYTLKLNAPQGSLTDGFVLISDDSSVSADDGYVLAVSYLALAEDVDTQSIRVFVGDRDVTSQTQFSESILVYREDRPQHGIKKALITAKVKGADVYSDTWITQVLPGSKKPALPFTYRGSVNFAANAYGVSDNGKVFGNPADDYSTWADLYGNYGIVDMQANLLVSSLEEKNAQPVNRYTFGVQIPMLDVFFGDYSPSLSQFTLSGKNIRGLYGKFYTRNLELVWAHGESVRKTEFDASETATQNSTFKQEAIGARLQFGSNQNFRMGFTGARHRDIISSLDEIHYSYINAENDTVYTVRPQDNAVVSFDMQLNVPDQHFVAGFEVAGSLLNTNTLPGAITVAEMEDYGLENEIGGIELDPEDFADTFIINTNIEPFMPSMANMAWNAYVRMYFWNNFLNLQYNETGSAFNSIGTFGHQRDTRILSITDQFSFGRLITISGGFSTTEDNLMEHKSETNTYQNIFASAIIRIPNMPYLKASFNDNSGENEQNSDIVDSSFDPITSNARNMSFGIGYNIVQIPYVPTQLDISYRMGSNNIKRTINDTYTSDNANTGIGFTMSNRFSMVPLRTQISYSTSTNKDDLFSQKYKNNSIFLKADYSLWQDRIRPYVSFRNTGLSGDYDDQTYNYINFGVESYPLRNMTVTADLGMMNYKNDDVSNQDYDTTTFRLCLNQRF